MPKSGQDRNGGVIAQPGVWNKRAEATKENQDQMEGVSSGGAGERFLSKSFRLQLASMVGSDRLCGRDGVGGPPIRSRLRSESEKDVIS